MTNNTLIENLLANGFDRSRYNHAGPNRVACSRCKATVSNGVPAHQIGCLNIKHDRAEQPTKPTMKTSFTQGQTQAYQPKTGQHCSCRAGQQRDNCPQCEGTGWCIDFAAIRAASKARASNQVRHTGIDMETHYAIQELAPNGIGNRKDPSCALPVNISKEEAIKLFTEHHKNTKDDTRHFRLVLVTTEIIDIN